MPITNYYEELNLDKTASIDAINQELSKLENIWRRREITNPEKAAKMVAMIIEARSVFKDTTLKAKYDTDLNTIHNQNSEKQDDRGVMFQNWQEQARTYLNNREYDLAKTAIERALNFMNPDTNNDVFYYLVADVYYSNRDYRAALNYINKAIVENQSPRQYVLKAAIYGGLMHERDNSGINYASERYNLLDIAIKLANQRGLEAEAGIAYGVYAALLYHNNQKTSAEEYAKKAVQCGDAWGNSSDVLQKIANDREVESKRAAEQKRNQELAEKRRQEEIRQEEFRKKETEIKQKREKTRKVIAHILYWPSLIIYLLLAFNYLTAVITTFYHSPISASNSDIVTSLVYLCIVIAIFVMANELMNGFSAYVIVIFGIFTIGLTLLVNAQFTLLLYCIIGNAIAMIIGRTIGKKYNKQ